MVCDYVRLFCICLRSPHLCVYVCVCVCLWWCEGMQWRTQFIHFPPRSVKNILPWIPTSTHRGKRPLSPVHSMWGLWVLYVWRGCTQWDKLGHHFLIGWGCAANRACLENIKVRVWECGIYMSAYRLIHGSCLEHSISLRRDQCLKVRWKVIVVHAGQRNVCTTTHTDKMYTFTVLCQTVQLSLYCVKLST